MQAGRPPPINTRARSRRGLGAPTQSRDIGPTRNCDHRAKVHASGGHVYPPSPSREGTLTERSRRPLGESLTRLLRDRGKALARTEFRRGCKSTFDYYSPITRQFRPNFSPRKEIMSFPSLFPSLIYFSFSLFHVRRKEMRYNDETRIRLE